jgi:hypothetical protein
MNCLAGAVWNSPARCGFSGISRPHKRSLTLYASIKQSTISCTSSSIPRSRVTAKNEFVFLLLLMTLQSFNWYKHRRELAWDFFRSNRLCVNGNLINLHDIQSADSRAFQLKWILKRCERGKFEMVVMNRLKVFGICFGGGDTGELRVSTCFWERRIESSTKIRRVLFIPLSSYLHSSQTLLYLATHSIPPTRNAQKHLQISKPPFKQFEHQTPQNYSHSDINIHDCFSCLQSFFGRARFVWIGETPTGGIACSVLRCLREWNN